MYYISVKREYFIKNITLSYQKHRLLKIWSVLPQRAVLIYTDTNTSRYTFEDLQEAAQYLLDRIKLKPKLGIICGSGMS